MAAPAVVTSTPYGAGYFAYLQDGRLASVGATFTVQPITCASGDDQEWLLPGIWIYDGDGNLVQQVDVNENCNFGSQELVDVVCLSNGACSTNLHPAPGDVIEATFNESSKGTVGVIRDRTQGTVDRVSGPAFSANRAVFVGDEGTIPFGVLAVPVFDKLQLRLATINGSYLADWHPTRYNLSTRGPTVPGDVQIRTGLLTTTAFNTIFLRSH